MTTPETIDRTSERFVIDYGDPEHSPARMVDVDELTERLARDIEAHHYGYADSDAATVYRYVPGTPPRLEQLTLTCVGREEFDEDDWAYPAWELTGSDGTSWATVGVRIDGRA